LGALVEYTMGQWSDGIGENLYQCPIHDEYDLLCLWSREVVLQCCPTAAVGAEYPAVEVTDEQRHAEPGAAADRRGTTAF
jgi:hypothetical protein